MENKLTVKNLQVNYKVIGKGQPLLILHGWGSNAERWQKVAELLEIKGYMIIIPDLPGFGKSQEPLQSWSMDNYVAWLAEFVAKIPELQSGFYLAGHSFGGAVAVKFSILHNQKVKKLILVASACIRKHTVARKIWYRLAKMIKIFSFLPGWELFRKAMYKFVLRKSDYPYVSGIMKETYLRVISDDLSYKVRFLSIPTILIWGDKDESTPVEQARFMSEKIPGSTLHILAGADHSPHIKLPELLAEKITECLT